jgi:hypothetical protein
MLEKLEGGLPTLINFRRIWSSYFSCGVRTSKSPKLDHRCNVECRTGERKVLFMGISILKVPNHREVEKTTVEALAWGTLFYLAVASLVACRCV